MKRSRKPMTLVDWLRHVEELIAAHSSPARTRGKYKGHASTDLVWVAELVREIELYIRRSRRGINYDENMAVASFTAFVLGQWYLHVHRAKCYDENRPLLIRRKALRARNKWLEDFLGCALSDRIMSKAWKGQKLSPPFGKGAKGGKFV